MADFNQIKRDLNNPSLTLEDINKKYSEADLEAYLERQPGFIDRMLASFGGDPQQEANILRTRGFEATVSPEGQVVTPAPVAPVVGGERQRALRSDVGGLLAVRPPAATRPVDPEGFDIADIGEVAGSLPVLAGEVLGGTTGAALAGGTTGGLATLAGGAMGASTGAALGEAARQKISRALGSLEPASGLKMATEAAFALAGEGIGLVAGKFLRGLFARSRKGADISELMAEVRKFDKQHGTKLEELAPADAQTGSEFVGRIHQRARESEFGGEVIKKKQDLPFEEEIERGYGIIRDKTGRGAEVKKWKDMSSGQQLKEAAEETQRQRLAERKRLYDEFGEEVDPRALPALDNTQEAIASIGGTKILSRKKTGAQGVEVLKNALEEAREIKTFTDLEGHRAAVGAEVENWDPARLNKDVNAQLKRLWVGLRKDEDAFLDAGGRRSTAPEELPEFAFAKSDQPAATAARKAAARKLTPNQIIKAAGGLNPREIKQIKKNVTLDRGKAGLLGKLKTEDGLDFDALFKDIEASPEFRSVFEQAGITSRSSLYDAIRTGRLFKKYEVAGEEVSETLISEGEREFAARELSTLFDDIQGAGSLEDLAAPRQRVQEALDSDLIAQGDADSFTDALTEAAERIQQATTPPDMGVPALGQSKALVAGRRARDFAKDMYTLDKASPVRKVFGDDFKLSEVPDKLWGMNADEVRAVKEAVGMQGTKGGLQASKEGQQAWQRVQVDLLDQLKQKARNPKKSTAKHFVLSGDRLESALRGLKPGALDEVFGPPLAKDLLAFADMIRGLSISERQFANFSGSSQGMSSILVQDIPNLIINPQQAAGRILGKVASQRILGSAFASPKGKRFLLGDLPWQQEHDTFIQGLSRTLGQSLQQGGREAYDRYTAKVH